MSRVLTQGEFSQRGDILDIFDMQSETPYRIEFLEMRLMAFVSLMLTVKNP